MLLNTFLQKALRPVPIAAAIFLLLIGALGAALCAASGSVKTYVVVLDPGHGGAGRGVPDDKWDSLSQKYLQYYAPGTHHKQFREHKIALDIAKRIKGYLSLTQNEVDWPRFEKLLREFTDQKHLPRVALVGQLSREDGWDDRKLPVSHPDVNVPYRLYDFPKKGQQVLEPGRISAMNAMQPHLILSIHLNPAGKGSAGGMAAVLAPGYDTFNLLREISLGRKKTEAFTKSAWHAPWLITDAGWSRFQAARSDAWVYFHGYRTKKNGNPWLEVFRGYRHNMVTWRYADPPGWEMLAREHGPGPYALNHRAFRPTGRFWTRERGRGEVWRRSGGRMGFGGDNHYASDELMRFVQYGARRMLPQRRKPGAMPEILKPFVSTYSLPTYVNAVCAYLEIAHINRDRDRTLVIEDADTVARSIAAGIYSLFSGLQLRRQPGPYAPKGQPVDFARYERLPGNYFKSVVE